MAAFVDHLYNGVYPYVTPEEFTAHKSRCKAARDEDPDDELIIDAITDASLIVYYLTGRQFNGTGTTTVTPYLCPGGCAPTRLTFGLWPVTDIIAVRENGVDQDPTDYHIDEYRYMVKNDGTAFPYYANWYAAAGDPDDDSEHGYVFEVTVEHGLPAPGLIKRAVTALACYMYVNDADSDCEDCEYSEFVSNISRTGVSLDMDNIMDLIRNKSTGIYAVELARQVFNPTGMQSPSFVWTPEIARGVRRYT